MGKHALLVNGSYLPTVGGVENSIRSIAAELVKEGWKVDVVCSDEGKYSRYEKTNNVSVYRYAKKGFFRSLYNSFRVLKEINKKYQLIICRNHTLFIILKFAGYKNIHYIIPGVYHYQNKSEMRGSLSKKIKYASNVFIQIVSFNISKLKYVFSPTMEDQVCSVSIFNKSVKKIYPGVDDTRFYKLDRKLKNNLKLALGFDNDSKIVLGLGRFVDVKNFEHLIKCVPYLPCDYKVVLVGGGDNLTVYKKIIGELNLINRVFIFESTLEPEKFYQIADVFCLTSTYEPFGQVLIEASFCGLNIVAFDSDLKGIDTATNSIFIHDCDFYFPVSSFELSDFAKEIINAVTCNRSSLCQNEFNKQYNWKALIERLSID